MTFVCEYDSLAAPSTDESAFTIRVSELRVVHRRVMNERDQEAGGRAMDSLLNYETVKYFGAETREAERYDRALAAYETAAVRAQLSLSGLNVGQGLIIASGLVAIMLLAASGIADGSMTIGDFVAVNAYLIQLYVPLNVLGFVYRRERAKVLRLFLDAPHVYHTAFIREEREAQARENLQRAIGALA